MAAKKGLYHNMNKRKKAGTSRSKKNSTISPKAYANMKKGFPKKKKWKYIQKQVKSLKALTTKCLMDKSIQEKNIVKIVSVYIKQRKDNGNIPR